MSVSNDNELDESVSTETANRRRRSRRATARRAEEQRHGGAEEQRLGGPQPAVVPEAESAKRQPKGGIQGSAEARVAATEHALEGPNQKLMRAQKPVWDALNKYYFSFETSVGSDCPRRHRC